MPSERKSDVDFQPQKRGQRDSDDTRSVNGSEYDEGLCLLLDTTSPTTSMSNTRVSSATTTPICSGPMLAADAEPLANDSDDPDSDDLESDDVFNGTPTTMTAATNRTVCLRQPSVQRTTGGNLLHYVDDGRSGDEEPEPAATKPVESEEQKLCHELKQERGPQHVSQRRSKCCRSR
jgi:hypothetical protein